MGVSQLCLHTFLMEWSCIQHKYSVQGHTLSPVCAGALCPFYFKVVIPDTGETYRNSTFGVLHLPSTELGERNRLLGDNGENIPVSLLPPQQPSFHGFVST